MDNKQLKIRVVFDTGLHRSDKHYVYNTHIKDLLKNDYVVVMSRNGLGVARVIEYIINAKYSVSSWAIHKVDLADYRTTSLRKTYEIKYKNA